MIFGITGKKQSGKDTFASIINYIHLGMTDKEIGEELTLPVYPRLKKYPIKKFATKIKLICEALFGKIQNYELFKQRFIDEVQMTGREFMQKVGTDLFRDNIHPDIWVTLLFQDYEPLEFPYHDTKTRDNLYHHTQCTRCKKPYSGWKRQYYCKECSIELTGSYPIWFITDVRFLNEAQAIKDRGGKIIRIIRGESSDQHQSELEMEFIEPDFTIENKGSLKEFIKKTRSFYEDHFKELI